MDDGTRSSLIKTVVMIALVAVVVFAVFFIVVKRGPRDNTTKEESKLTVVDEIVSLDLDRSYPPTPREVVELYLRIRQAMYRQSYTDDQFSQMASRLAGIMDLELLNNQTNWPLSLRDEVYDRKKNDCSIVSFIVDKSDEVKVSNVNGADLASLCCILGWRRGTHTDNEKYQFLLRKDSEGRWKILGYEEVAQ